MRRRGEKDAAAGRAFAVGARAQGRADGGGEGAFPAKESGWAGKARRREPPPRRGVFFAERGAPGRMAGREDAQICKVIKILDKAETKLGEKLR